MRTFYCVLRVRVVYLVDHFAILAVLTSFPYNCRYIFSPTNMRFSHLCALMVAAVSAAPIPGGADNVNTAENQVTGKVPHFFPLNNMHLNL